jgi:hypothetical protein
MRITPIGASAVVLTLLTSSVLLARALNTTQPRTRRSPQPERRPNGSGGTTQRTATVRAPRAKSTEVYVTSRGRKYHRQECPSMRGENRSLPLAEARGSYDPCKVCDPPV